MSVFSFEEIKALLSALLSSKLKENPLPYSISNLSPKRLRRFRSLRFISILVLIISSSVHIPVRREKGTCRFAIGLVRRVGPLGSVVEVGREVRLVLRCVVRVAAALHEPSS